MFLEQVRAPAGHPSSDSATCVWSKCAQPYKSASLADLEPEAANTQGIRPYALCVDGRCHGDISLTGRRRYGSFNFCRPLQGIRILVYTSIYILVPKPRLDDPDRGRRH